MAGSLQRLDISLLVSSLLFFLPAAPSLLSVPDKSVYAGVMSDDDQPAFNQPLSGNEMPRFAGPATMFRLPERQQSALVDVGIVGVPLDIGTSNRVGARYGPRQLVLHHLILVMWVILVMLP